MRIRTSLVGLAAAVAALSAAAPASASTYTEIPTPNTALSFGAQAITQWTAAETRQAEGASVTHAVRAQNIGDVRSSEKTNISAECVAEATGASGTGIRQCYLLGRFTGSVYNIGDQDSLPGTTDASVGAKLEVLMEPFKVCIQSRILTRENSEFFETPLTCAAN